MDLPQHLVVAEETRRNRVRYRIDGALKHVMTYDIGLLAGISARIKIIGGMDIAEKRKPQDGRITIMVDRREYDVRVSILPTVYGEKTVMRLTSKDGLTKPKSALGFGPKELKVFDGILSNPHGIILVTGPTGSGKSTTLYTSLSELNTEDVNIITVEDPVEANIDGINQVQVNVKAEMTFAAALRSILRQDPDIIMIGEIRDSETAQIAVQAAITGHLVVSTLHTNSAASTVTRIIDMGIEPYVAGDALVGVIAQRLVRRLCSSCKQARLAEPEEKKILGVKPEDMDDDVIIYEPVGCPLCGDTGYAGRIGVYEMMPVSKALQAVISKGATADVIEKQAEHYEIMDCGYNEIREYLTGLTARLCDNIMTVCTKREGSVIKAVVYGDKADLDEEEKELYVKNGIAHILTVSGLHMSVAGMGLYHVLRKRFSFLTSGVVSGILIWFFWIMTGGGISVTRAFLMMLLRMIADVAGRTYDLKNALGGEFR